jgi:hypothetical protein
MDFLPNRDRYEAFVEYQSRLLAQFEAMADEYGFLRVDATPSIREVFKVLKASIRQALSEMKPVPPQEAEEVLSQVVALQKPGRKQAKKNAG